MFCRNCGTDVTDMKCCPKCGTPTAIENENVATGEKFKVSKFKRKYVLSIFGVGIALLVIAVTALLSKSSSETIGNTAIPTMNMMEESPQVTEETTNEEKWYTDKWYVDVKNPRHYINFYDGEDGLLHVRVTGYGFTVGQPEMIDGGEEFGTASRYSYMEESERFEFLIDYLPVPDTIIILFTYNPNLYRSANAIDYSGLYAYDSEFSERMNSVYNMEESPLVTEETTDEEDITHNWWKDKAFQSTDSGLYFWIEEDVDGLIEENGNGLWFMVGPEYLNDQNCLVVGAVDKSEISVGIEEEYGYIYYSFHDNTSLTQALILYDPNNDMVFVTSKSDLNDKWLNESDTYYAVDPAEQPDEIYEEQQPDEAYEESTEVLASAENGILIEDSYISDNADDSAVDRGNMVNYFLDGQRFECFETNSGEDMILTIYLFYNSDGNGNMISDIPSMYKGTLSNGTEFWFEPYESSQDSERYVINCDDGSAAYLEYRMDMSEINFLVENGILYNYGGTYIGLPDSEN